MKDKKPLDWIPLWIDKHLFGSTRIELEPDERSVWTDMLALAGKDKGFIRANEGCPYQPAQLAGMLIISTELLDRAIQKFIKYKKVKRMRDGTLYLPSWEEYNFSERHRRRLMSEKTDTRSAKEDKARTKADTIVKNRIVKDRIEYKKVPKGTVDEDVHEAVPMTPIEIIGIDWNTFAEEHGLAKIKEIKKNSTREKHIKARMKEDKEFDFGKMLQIIEASPFLLGQTKANFNIFFDWVFLPTNYQKIMEGNYLDRTKKMTGGIATWLKKYGDKE